MRNICFVTGTRAEFGLMQTTLRAIDAHRKLNLQIIATGMRECQAARERGEQPPMTDEELEKLFLSLS